MALQVPESGQSPCQPEGELAFAGGPESLESGTEVVVVALQPIEPGQRVESQVRFGLLGQGQEVLGVAAPKLLGLTRLVEALRGVLADRLEHAEATIDEAQEALVNERLERIEVGLGHRLGGFERATAAEHGGATEKHLLVEGEQVVAPCDRSAKGALSFGQVARAAGQQTQTPLEARQDLCRGERLDAGGRQLDGQREVVQPTADLGDRLVGDEAGFDGPGSGQEQRKPLGGGQRRHRVFLLAADVERLAAGRQQREMGTGRQQVG